jgi:hypothetical protein
MDTGIIKKEFMIGTWDNGISPDLSSPPGR